MAGRKSVRRARISKWILTGLMVAIIAVGVVVRVHSDGSKAPAGTGGIKIVAAENFWGDIAKQVGGSHVTVTSIISDPSTDPHLYESDARDAAAIASADMVIENGLGYDSFLDKLLSATTNKDRVMLSASQILGITQAGSNPHVWYYTSRVHLIADQIGAALSAKDPANKISYDKSVNQFDQSLQPILDKITLIKSKYPAASVAYTEPIAGYMLEDAGLTIKTPEGFAKAIEDGNDPSPADTAALDNLIVNREVKVLLYNSQATSPVTQHLRDLASQVGMPVVPVSETIPAGEKSYQTWQMDQMNALIAALDKK